jgi:hypothetical protein
MFSWGSCTGTVAGGAVLVAGGAVRVASGTVRVTAGAECVAEEAVPVP